MNAAVFVTPCFVLNVSLMGITGADLADGASSRHSPHEEWDITRGSSFRPSAQGNIDGVLHEVKAVHDAGVNILVDTNTSAPLPSLVGLAHGARLDAARGRS